MRVAYADPPYLGCCARYGHYHGDGGCWDDGHTHQQLIWRLSEEFPDGWALSLSTPSLRDILPMCPTDARVAAWVKPWASFKPNVNPAYTWEPVIWRGGRSKRGRDEPTVRDYVTCGTTMEKGLTGAKPVGFCWWLFELLGLQADDVLVDLFPGTGIVSQTWEQCRRQGQLFRAKVSA